MWLPIKFSRTVEYQTDRHTETDQDNQVLKNFEENAKQMLFLIKAYRSSIRINKNYVPIQFQI